MRYLLDTCTFLWATTREDALSETAAAVLADERTEIFLSVVTAWEVAVKHSSGRLRLKDPPAVLLPRGRNDLDLESLDVDEAGALGVAKLPWIHRDPFDRLLVAQAIQHGLTILTPDKTIAKYPAATLW